MALTYAQLQDEVATVIGTGARSGDVMRTSIKRWINQACRRIAFAHEWNERRAEQRVATVAPYTTGTLTFTQGSASVVGVGTTWTAAMIGRKIALGIGSPYYRITAVGSTTTLTIADVYAEATAATSTYTIFQDEYDLATDTHSIEDSEIFRSTWSGPFVMYDQVRMDRSSFVPWSTGAPLTGCVCTSTTAGVPRIRVSPSPDAIYRIAFRYLKAWTDMSGDSDLYTATLPVDVEELILDRKAD